MSTATHGYNNAKMYGKPVHNTVHNLGSSKHGQNVISKAVAEVTATAQAVVSVTTRDKDKELIIEITGHGAKVGDICRFYTGVAARLEYDIIEVIDANNFVIQNIGGVVPVAADTAKVLYYVTSKADSEGNVNFSPGPAQFVQDGSAVTVNEDTVAPANNRPSPSSLYFTKDGVKVPVTLDTTDPTNNIPLPTSEASTSIIAKALHDFAGTPVTSGAWVELVADIGATEIKKAQLFMSQGEPLELGFGAAAAEASQGYIFPGGNGSFDLRIPPNTRVSLRAVSTTANTGILLANFLG